VEENPKGTGEDDFALLRVTGRVGGGAPPEEFPHILPDTDEDALAAGHSVLLAAYPAGFLGGAVVQKDFWPVSAVSAVKEVFTFNAGTLDLLSVGGSVVAQKGSSGGVVVDMETENLVGIIVTSTDEESTGDRELRAITLAHINRSMLNDIGANLGAFLAGDPAVRQRDFEETRADLMQAMLAAILER